MRNQDNKLKDKISRKNVMKPAQAQNKMEATQYHNTTVYLWVKV